MNNDFISREALKEAIRKRLGISSLKYLTEQEKVIVDEIDNAPTIEERPHGEWKFIQGATTQGSLKCSFCNYRNYHKTNYNFCPNCGSDMRQEASE